MDNTRDVRRFGASRFSFAKRQSIKQSGFVGGDDDGGTISDKSKRRLNVSGTVTEEEEMGCVGSDVEEELRPTTNNRKIFKLSKKFFDECNNVDHASVPRKLRSAMKKRSGESVSPPLPDTRKVKHMVNGNVLARKNGTKKSKLSMQNGEPEGSPKQIITGPITRDEEEVVETLFALAGMFSNNDKIDESSKLDSKFSEVKSSTLPESSTPPVLKEEGDLQTNDSSALETAKVQCVNELSQADLTTSQKNPVELDDYVPQGNVTTLPEPTSERPTCNSVGHLVNKHDGSSASERKLDIAMDPPVPAYRSQIDLHPAITKTKNSGSGLWPGLCTTDSLDAEICGPPLQSCTAKLPAWMGNASISRQPCSSKNLVLTEKESRVEVGKKNLGKKKNAWKRCSAHVYISRLIKVLQIKEGKDDALPVQQLNNCDQLKTNEGSNQEAVLAANNNNIVVVDDKMNSCPNGVGYANNMVFSSDVERSSNEVRNAILLHKRLLEDHNQKQVPTTSGPYASQKQSFDFMSVSAGDYEGVSDNNNRGAANGLESSTPFHFPYLHSIAQNQTTMPQNHRFSSSSFPHHFSAATAQQVQQVQLPPYLCSPFSGPSGMENPVLSEQQQLQRLWTAQQAAQYRAGDVIDPTHLPSWQNGRQGGGSPSLIQYAQAMFPPISHSSLELLGPNYAMISPQHQQQQQQFISLLPPPSRAKRHTIFPLDTRERVHPRCKLLSNDLT